MSHKTREPRQTVTVSVRYRGSAGWADAQIRNVSSHGVMALCQSPPARGSYVEIRCGSYAMVGRVAWSATDRFGMRTRDRVETAELVAAGTRRDAPGTERRSSSRTARIQPAQPRKTDLAGRQAASARFARAFGFVAVAAIAAGLALAAAQVAHSALSAPLAAIDQTLRQSR